MYETRRVININALASNSNRAVNSRGPLTVKIIKAYRTRIHSRLGGRFESDEIIKITLFVLPWLPSVSSLDISEMLAMAIINVLTFQWRKNMSGKIAENFILRISE